MFASSGTEKILLWLEEQPADCEIIYMQTSIVCIVRGDA